MSVTLKIVTEEVDTAIAAIRAEIAEMTEMQQSIASQNENLVRNWEGNTGNGFLQSGISLEKVYNEVIEEMKLEADLLERYNTSIKVTEENAVNSSALTNKDG